MRNVEIDCRNITSPRALQIFLQYRMDYPDWYGRNLDALYDMLTEDNRPVCITFVTDSGMNPEMTEYMQRLCRVLEDAAGENASLTYRLIKK
ncbi:MAG: barstar family protein [Clostridia bacterium]|nr:barstar family protein [Clostridia bacterium]